MLSINFHKTFIPERRLIAAILEFAHEKKEGTYQEISAETGIPMGKSSGKVPAILNYARGMGLISTEKGNKGQQPVLTGFGEIVFKEDKYLSEVMTQWLAHMNLCRPDIGAKAWHAFFAKGSTIIGANCSKEEIENYLDSEFGPGKNRTGPMLLMYSDGAAFEKAAILSINKENVARNKAPLLDSYALPYSAYILSLIEAFFPTENQITLTEFNAKTHWFDICFWKQIDVENMLAIVERKGFITVDRQMKPWIIERMAKSDEIWPEIYKELA